MRARLLVLAVAAAGVAVAVVLGSQALLQREQARPPAAIEGRALYLAHCAVCHGRGGKGDGPGAAVLAQRIQDFSDPAALRAANDQFLFDIIQKGGSQFGRSNGMPAWGVQLSNGQIRSLVTYIHSLASASSGASGRKETP